MKSVKVKTKKIGRIVGSTFKKVVERNKHLFWSVGKFGAWGIDNKVFNNVIKPECDTIEIYDKQTKTTYKTSVENFEENSTFLHFKPHGVQRFLRLELWKEVR